MDINDLMAQAAELQSKVNAAQDKLDKIIVKGISGNGDAIVEMTGKYVLKKLTLNPAIFTRDVHEVEQIVMSAFCDAKDKADMIIDGIMGDATAGVKLPE